MNDIIKQLDKIIINVYSGQTNEKTEIQLFKLKQLIIKKLKPLN